MRKFIKIATYTLLVLMLLLLFAPALIYVPWVQRVAVEQTLRVLNDNDLDMHFEVGGLSIRFPFRIELRDVLVTRASTADTIASLGYLRTAIDKLPLDDNYVVVDEFVAEKIRLGLDSTLVSGLDLDGSLDTLNIAGVKYNPQDNELRVRSINIARPVAEIMYHNTDTVPDNDTLSMAPWYVDLGELNVTDANLSYDKWHLQDLNLWLTDFSLDTLRTHFDTLRITLPESYLAASGDVDLTYLQDSTKGWAYLNLDASLSRPDLMMVAAEALPNMQRYWPQRGALAQCLMYLTPDTLMLSPFVVSVPDYVDINAVGAANHPFDNNLREANLRFDAKLNEADSLLAAFYEAPHKRDYLLPSRLNVTAKVQQRKANYKASARVVQDSLQVVDLDATLNHDRMSYSLKAEVSDLDVADYYPSLDIRGISAHLDASGRNFSFGRRNTRLDANFVVDSILYVITDTLQASALAHVNLKMKGDSIDANGLLNVHVPEVGNFDSLYVDFKSSQNNLDFLLTGGDASVDLTAACGVNSLVEIFDNVTRQMDVQRTNKAFDINAIQRQIPELSLNARMQHDNPIMPVLDHYGVWFDRAYITLTNTDSLHLKADIDTLRYDAYEVAHIGAELLPNDGDYDYLGNATYKDTLTDLTFDLGVKAYLDSKEIDMLGFVLVDSMPAVNFDAFLTHGIEADIYMDDFPLTMANMFMPKEFDLSGYLNGHASLSSDTVDFSAIEADIWTRQGKLFYEGAGMTIGLPEDSIHYRRGQLIFDNVRCMASNKRPVTIDGVVDLNGDISNPDIDLRVTADNVRLINSRRRETRNQFVYGRLPLSSSLTIRGKADDLAVNGSLSVLSGCDVTAYYEDNGLSDKSRLSNLVEFSRFDDFDNHRDSLIIEGIVPEKRVARKEGSVTANLKLSVDKAAKALVYLPTSSDDRLQLQGGGDLKLTMDKGGNLMLGGEFDVVGGDINFKLPMLPMTKEFALSSDSWLRWSGDPLQPEINLTATQHVKCTINDATQGARVVKFLVSVLISGTLDEMEVAFTCSAPDDAAIESELSSLTPEELSKQAMMLLIAQMYTGPSAANSSAGLNSANAALNALLNKEIETLLTQKLKHTEINFDIDTYDATGTGSQQTDYNLSVSQKFFNDRMRVTLGGKMSTGDEVVQRDDQIINDISVEWMIKKDGSHFARIFRKTNYESVLEGQVIESGIGYVQQRQAYRFWQLFLPRSKKRQAAVREAIEKLQKAEIKKNENDSKHDE